MFSHQGLAMVVLVVAADGSVSTDPELAIARAMFAREFPDVDPRREIVDEPTTPIA